MIRAVLFDIDGTLIDSNSLHVDAWAQAFAQAGRDVSADDIAGQIGKGGDNLVPALIPDASEAEVERLSKRHGKIFKARYLARAKPFADAAALLRRVRADGRKVVLASSASEEEVEHYLDLLGVKAIVAATTSIDDVETSKPAPDIFSVALKKAGVRADEAVVVGDTPYDAASAAKAGMGTVGVLSGGFSEGELRGEGAAAVYRDVADLLSGYEGSVLAE